MKKIIGLLFLFNIGFINAQLRLPALFADNMVLQQKKVNRVWGWADPGQLVQVDFLEKNYPAYADANGNWSVFIDAAPAGKTGTMAVWAGETTFEFNNVAIGEVWICSGQSNMEWRMDMLKETYPQELKTARNENIRFMVVEKTLATSPQKDLPVSTKWTAVTPETVGACSAVAYSKRVECAHWTDRDCLGRNPCTIMDQF